MANPRRLYDTEELAEWYCPSEVELKESDRSNYRRARAALTAALTGELSFSRAAAAHQLCRKRLARMAEAAPRRHADGMPNGFRVCVPWGTYSHGTAGDVGGRVPSAAGPGAMRQLLQALPLIRTWVEGYQQPLPPGRAPRGFDRLHERICAELGRQDLADHYPLNTPDRGRRALLDYLRRSRIMAVVPGTLEVEQVPVRKLEDAFRGRIFVTCPHRPYQ